MCTKSIDWQIDQAEETLGSNPIKTKLNSCKTEAQKKTIRDLLIIYSMYAHPAWKDALKGLISLVSVGNICIYLE